MVYEHEESWALHVSIFTMHNKGLLIFHTVTCTNPFLRVDIYFHMMEYTGYGIIKPHTF